MLSREGQDIENILKALKIVVMDMKKRMDDQIEDFEGLKNQITGQDGEIQALSNMINQVLEQVEGGAGTPSPAEGSLSFDDEKLRTLEETLETTKNRLDQLEPKLEDLAISQQTLASLEVARDGSADSERWEQLETKLTELESKHLESPPSNGIDTERLTQLEAKLADLENKSLTGTPGDTVDLNLDRLAQLEAKLEELETTLHVTPSEAVDMERLAQLEAKITKLESTPQVAPSETMDVERLAQLEAKLEELETTLHVTPSEAVDMERLAQLEAKITKLESTPQVALSETMDVERLAQLEAKLADIEIKVPEGAPSESADPEKVSQLEEKVDTIETKVFSIRGKLAEFEDMLTTVNTSGVPSTDVSDVISRLDKLERTVSEPVLPPEIDRLPTRLDIIENTVSRLEATPATPSSELTAITSRLESLEATISSRPVERMPERELAGVSPSQLEVTTINTPTPAPSETPAPTSGAPASKGVLTMKDRVLTIVEELVSCSAMQIAMKLQLSTASIINDLRQLEVEGRLTLSGDVETNPDVKLE